MSNRGPSQKPFVKLEFPPVKSPCRSGRLLLRERIVRGSATRQEFRDNSPFLSTSHLVGADNLKQTDGTNALYACSGLKTFYPILEQDEF